MLFTLLDRCMRDLLYSSRLVPQSLSTNVCAKCYKDTAPFNNIRWLTWLECGQHPDHEEEDRVTLIVGDSNNVAVARKLPACLEGCHPQQLALCKKVHWRGGCSDGYNCNRAHSNEELEYWKWSLVHRKLLQVFIVLVTLLIVELSYFMFTPSRCQQTTSLSRRATATHLMKQYPMHVLVRNYSVKIVWKSSISSYTSMR